MLRGLLGLIAGAAVCCAAAESTVDRLPANPAPLNSAPVQPTTRILLIPLDDRPATTQFAQMIGRMAGALVETPPAKYLGRFTTPGSPDALLGWLKARDLGEYDSVLVSTDMIAYGGLIASRLPDTTYAQAIERLRSLQRLRRDLQQRQKDSTRKTRFYGFSSIMRLSPTATRDNGKFRMQIGRYLEIQTRYQAQPDPKFLKQLENLRGAIPARELSGFLETRRRDHLVQQELVRMTRWNVFDYLILGQDDAQPIGPHVAETLRLKTMASNLGIGPKVYFCEGIDQHSNVLVSRSLTDLYGWQPKVRIVYADETGRDRVAHYEADRVEASLKDQLHASGAEVSSGDDAYDYSLYVNTPEPRPEEFAKFVASLQSEIDQGFPVAVADINLGKQGTGSPELFDALSTGGRAVRLVSYAGWNTAGNTMGTAIPAANVYMLGRRLQYDPLRRELAQKAFLLHRLVNDFEYHRYTRPAAYAIQDRRNVAREESYGTLFDEVNEFVRQEMENRLNAKFREAFQGRRFFAGDKQYELTALSQVDVELPWPRAYEVRIGFELQAQEAPPLP